MHIKPPPADRPAQYRGDVNAGQETVAIPEVVVPGRPFDDDPSMREKTKKGNVKDLTFLLSSGQWLLHFVFSEALTPFLNLLKLN